MQQDRGAEHMGGREVGGGGVEHSVAAPIHAQRYGWEIHCSCGWSRRKRFQGEVEAAGEAHLEEHGEVGGGKGG